MISEQATFGEWLKERRNEVRATQEECASAAGVTRAMWAKWEAGESNPRRDKLALIAAVLDVSAVEAFHRAGYVAPGTASFGGWVRDTRERKRFGVVDCARRAGMPSSQWSKIEADEPRKADGSAPEPRRETVERMAMALEVPVKEALQAAYGAGLEASNSNGTSFPDGLPPLMQEDLDKVIEYARMLHDKRKNTAE